ncbi:MAG: serine hydrolase [Candidatus Aminicenantes bacterium]|nr:serine hydrolase [Candidatus Aminicenantes bacterium]
MNHRYFYMLFFLITVLLLGCGQSQTPPTLGEILEAEIPRLMEKAEVPGLSIAVVKNGVLFWSGAFGIRSGETGEPVDEATIFEAASISKTITAAAALKLVERGQLDLDTSIFEYIPFPSSAKDERLRKITPRLILTHTTGLPNWGARIIREPGTLYGYSGQGFLFLGQAIERISGQTLEEFARQEIFEPLGMTHSSYVWNDLYAANGATGHDQYSVPQPRRRNTSPNGGASLLTTARDYATFLCAILNDEVLKPETIQKMLTPHVQATRWGKTEPDEHIHWGLGWGIQPGTDENAFWHWGNNMDLRGYTVASKNKKEGLVFFTNSENGFALAETLVALLNPDLQWSMKWLDWERYDHPVRVARRLVEQTFLNEGKEAGLERLNGVRKENPELFGTDDILQLASYLTGRLKSEEAASLYRLVVDLEPKRIQPRLALAMAVLDMEEFEEAEKSFSDVLDLASGNRTAKTGLQWAKDLAAANKNPVSIPTDRLQAYAGAYGPRLIEFRDGVLYYKREDRPEFRLLAVSSNTFSLVGYHRFRLRFNLNSEGRIVSVTGLYIEGREDISERTG